MAYEEFHSDSSELLPIQNSQRFSASTSGKLISQPALHGRTHRRWRSRIPVQPASRCTFPAFAPIVSDGFESLKGLPEEVTIPIGETLLEQNQSPASVYLLRKGLVKLVHVTSTGREMLLGLRSAGWYAGAVYALMHSSSIYSVKAVTPCICCKIPCEEFPMRLMQSARMTRHFMSTLCNELIAQSAEAQIKAGSADQRLSQFMSERNMQHAHFKTLDTLPLLKQLELAQLLSITPEHLSRLLRKVEVIRSPEEARE